MPSSRPLSRRDILCALALSTAALAAGCAYLRPRSPLDESLDELRRLLAESGSDEASALCEQIGETARAMLDTHNRFLVDFNHEAAAAETGEAALVALVTEYQSGIAAQRNHLLSLQDALYAQIPAEQWPAIREQLLDTGRQFLDEKATGAR